MNIGYIKYNFHNFIEQNVSIMILKMDLNLFVIVQFFNIYYKKKKIKIF